MNTNESLNSSVGMTVVDKATIRTCTCIDTYNRLLFEENVVILKPKWLVGDHQDTKFTA